MIKHFCDRCGKEINEYPYYVECTFILLGVEQSLVKACLCKECLYDFKRFLLPAAEEGEK